MKKKILIVEDEMIIQLVNQQIVEEAGYEVCSMVTCAEDAIVAVKNLMPDLILMDIKLDGPMDGIEAMTEIRKFSNVPVIYITGNSDPYHLNRAINTVMSDFLVKPVDFELMLKAIQNVFI